MPLEDPKLPAGTQPKTGDVLWGRYRIAQKLGSGAFGQVYAAEDLRQGRRVAIKTLRQGAGMRDPVAVARMRQEAEILRAIQHPNIVEVFDVGESEFGLFMAMELLEGRSIDQLLVSEGPASSERVAMVARQMLSALQTAHARGVLHRDLKPENIMLVPRAGEQARAADQTLVEGEPLPAERAKLVDFGIAKAREILDDDPEEGVTLVKTRGGAFVGTPRYCAPELVVGDPVGPSTDIFSLGLVLAEWLTGKERISAQFQNQALAILIQPEPLDVSDCPAAWQPWLAKMIAKFPSDRYASAKDALAHFDRLVGHGSGGAYDGDFGVQDATYVTTFTHEQRAEIAGHSAPGQAGAARDNEPPGHAYSDDMATLTDVPMDFIRDALSASEALFYAGALESEDDARAAKARMPASDFSETAETEVRELPDFVRHRKSAKSADIVVEDAGRFPVESTAGKNAEQKVGQESAFEPAGAVLELAPDISVPDDPSRAFDLSAQRKALDHMAGESRGRQKRGRAGVEQARETERPSFFHMLLAGALGAGAVVLAWWLWQYFFA